MPFWADDPRTRMTTATVVLQRPDESTPWGIGRPLPQISAPAPAIFPFPPTKRGPMLIGFVTDFRTLKDLNGDLVQVVANTPTGAAAGRIRDRDVIVSVSPRPARHERAAHYS